jgi:2'-5' RNA ligase
MKATIAYLTEETLANLGSSLLFQANETANVGYETARLPFHVSLKQPFKVESLETIESFFDRFASEIRPVKIKLDELTVYRNGLGGIDMGCLSIRIVNDELKQVQNKLFAKLKNEIGDCPAPFDDNYMFHMTIAIGKADFRKYQIAYEYLKTKIPQTEFVLDRLALFLYTDDNLLPGTYFCYKIIKC